MRKAIALETLPAYFGFDWSNVERLMSETFKHKGLDIPEPKRVPGGRKIRQDFLLPNTETIAVSIFFEDLKDDQENIVKIEKKVEIYFHESTEVYCKKAETETVRDIDKLLRHRYDKAYGHLRKSAKGTPIENHVNAILQHYSNEVNVWLLGDPSAFLTAIQNETDATINAYLNITVDPDGKKVINAITEQLTGVKWTPQNT